MLRVPRALTMIALVCFVCVARGCFISLSLKLSLSLVSMTCVYRYSNSLCFHHPLLFPGLCASFDYSCV